MGVWRHCNALVLSQLAKGYCPICDDEIKTGDPSSIEMYTR